MAWRDSRDGFGRIPIRRRACSLWRIRLPDRAPTRRRRRGYSDPRRHPRRLCISFASVRCEARRGPAHLHQDRRASGRLRSMSGHSARATIAGSCRRFNDRGSLSFPTASICRWKSRCAAGSRACPAARSFWAPILRPCAARRCGAEQLIVLRLFLADSLKEAAKTPATVLETRAREAREMNGSSQGLWCSSTAAEAWREGDAAASLLAPRLNRRALKLSRWTLAWSFCGA